MPSNRLSRFRDRVRARERVIGTFVKTPHHGIVEVLGRSSLDFVVLDAEHAPFDRPALDAALLAAHAVDLPTLVRVPRPEPAEILSVLDLGATGVMVPHVTDARSANAVAAACRYAAADGRGYSGSTRAAGFGTRRMRDVIAAANSQVTVVVQVEDAIALPELDAIATVEGVDCLFIGRMDLTVTLGCESPDDPKVVESVRAIHSAGVRHGRSLGIFITEADEIAHWLACGSSLFVHGSDQQWLLQSARAASAAAAHAFAPR